MSESPLTKDSEDGDETRRVAENRLAQIELLAEENRRLREEYVRARQSNYRRTALGLLAVGAVSGLAALAFPQTRDVLFALAGTGLFAAVLTYYLTPERFIAASVGERVYAAFAATGDELVSELGLRDERVYAPASADDEAFAGVRLFVPRRSDYSVPDPERLQSLFVVADDEREQGISVPASGASLYREFRRTMVDDLSNRADRLAVQLVDGLIEGFEVAETEAPDLDTERGRVTVEVSETAYGAVDQFDHPVPSFLAVGLADRLGTPVTVETRVVEDGESSVVTCSWDPDAVDSSDST